MVDGIRQLTIHIPLNRILPILVLLLSCDGKSQELVFEKALAQDRRVEMARIPIPYTGPSREELEELQSKKPGGKAAPPDAVYEYELRLNEGGDEPSRTLWKTEFKFWDRGPGVPSDFRVLDVAALGTNKILLLVKAGASTGCHLIPISLPSGAKTNDLAQDLFSDIPTPGRLVVSGRCYTTNIVEPLIELSLANNTTSRWKMKGTRFEEEPSAPPKKGAPIPPIAPVPELR